MLFYTVYAEGARASKVDVPNLASILSYLIIYLRGICFGGGSTGTRIAKRLVFERDEILC